MNPQRIEEFRKKLREGRGVRVREGLVEVDGTPAPAASTAPPPGVTGAPVVPSSEGVQVKPHEWGHA